MEPKNFEVTFNKRTLKCEYIKGTSLAKLVVTNLLTKDVLFGIDVETEPLPEYKHTLRAGLSPHLSVVRLLQICDGETIYIFDMRKIPTHIFLKLLSTKRFIAHNALFELQRFMQWGVVDMNIGCTMLLYRLLFHAIYPTDEGLSASLATVSELILGEKMSKDMQVSAWENDELTFEQIKYAALDAIAVIDIARKLVSGLDKFDLWRVYQLVKDVQHPIAAMQLNGIKLDRPAHSRAINIWREKLYSAKKEVLALTGLNELTSHTLAGWLEEHLDKETLSMWPRTESEKLSTDSDTFADFNWLPVIKPFSAYQKQEKLTSTYGNSLLQQLNPLTNRLHAGYNICGARTGRLSSSKPNLQNMPRSPDPVKEPGVPDIRSHFIPEEGFSFIVADYSQIELRVAAELSQDEEMLNAYRKGIDLHALTASIVSNKALKDVSKEDRQKGKALNFGLLFGLGSAKYAHYARKSYGVEVSDEEARDAIELWRELYHGYFDYQMSKATEGRETLKVRTPCGKLRALHPDRTYGTSMNTGAQGGAAEVMMYALIRIFNEISCVENVKLVNCVHDEIILEVPDELVEPYKEIVVQCMTDAYLDVFPSGVTRGLVSLNSGKSWAEAK